MKKYYSRIHHTETLSACAYYPQILSCVLQMVLSIEVKEISYKKKLVCAFRNLQTLISQKNTVEERDISCVVIMLQNSSSWYHKITASILYRNNKDPSKLTLQVMLWIRESV